MADDRPPRNPFVRWKEHVDAHIGSTLNGLFGIPSLLAPNLSAASPPAASLRRTPGSGPAPTIFSPDTPIDAAQAEAFLAFYYHSPCSPLHLQHLSPPRPAALPHDAPVTFADAFEDLLADASGRPMRDLRQVAARGRDRGSREDPRTWFHRLNAVGVLDACFARSGTPLKTQRAAVLDSKVDDWERLAKLGLHRSALWSQRHHPGASMFGYDPLGRGFFGDMADVFRVVQHIFGDEEEEGYEEAAEAHEKEVNEKNEKDHTAREPQHALELSEAVRSAWAEADKSWSEFAKAINDSLDHDNHSSDRDSGYSEPATPSEATSVDRASPSQTPASGAELHKVTTTNKDVDDYGNEHCKVVVRTLDADGNEVAREERYTFRSAKVVESSPSRHTDTQEAESDRPRQQPPEKDKEEKKSGWLWK